MCGGLHEQGWNEVSGKHVRSEGWPLSTKDSARPKSGPKSLVVAATTSKLHVALAPVEVIPVEAMELQQLVIRSLQVVRQQGGREHNMRRR